MDALLVIFGQWVLHPRTGTASVTTGWVERIGAQARSHAVPGEE